MNREILFRGKRLENGEWVYGVPLFDWATCPLKCKNQHKGDLLTFYGWSDVCHDYYEFEVDESTIGQYTGLTDRNGVKIFEGDIIKAHYKNAIKADFVEYVVFHKGRFCATPDDKHIWAGLADGIKHPPRDKGVYMEWCEVIGNIFDNNLGELNEIEPVN